MTLRRLKRVAAVLTLLIAGAAVWVLFWPPPEAIVAPAESMLDVAMPIYHHRAMATRRICAAPEAIDRAFRELKAEEIEGFGAILTVRRRRGQAVGAVLRDPMFDALRRASIVPVADLPREELVVGTAGPFWTLRGPRGAQAGEIRKSLRAVEGDPRKFAALEFPDAAKAAMNVRISVQVDGSCPLVSSEFRVYCPQPAGLKSLTRLWRIAGPARAYLHRNLLSAIAKHAGER